MSTSITITRICNIVENIKTGDDVVRNPIINDEFTIAKSRVKTKLSKRKDYTYNCAYDAVYDRLFAFTKAIMGSSNVELYKIDSENSLEPYVIAAIIVMDEYMAGSTSLLDHQIFEYVIMCATRPLEEELLKEIVKLK